MSWGAAAAAGASVLGGILDNRAAQQSAEQAYSLKKQWALEGPGFIRKGAEDAGFNPLVFAGAQTYNPSPVAPGQGSLAQAAQAGLRQIDLKRERAAERELRAANLANEREKIGLEAARLAEMKRNNQMNEMLRARQINEIGKRMEAYGRNAKARADSKTDLQTFTPILEGTPHSRRTGSKGGPMKINFLGRDWEVPPGMSISEDAQQIGGEALEGVVGLTNLYRIIDYNLDKDLNNIGRYVTGKGRPKPPGTAGAY